MSNRVKREVRAEAPTNVAATTEERDLDEWARRLATRTTPQIGTATQGGQSNLNNFLIIAAPQVATGKDGLPLHVGYDADSAVGKFTWHTVGPAGDEKYVPCLYRCKEKFCSIKMAEISLFGEYLKMLPFELIECINLNCYNATNNEAKLLHHINNWHCDQFYGAEWFTTKDVLVSTADVEKFYEFLYFAFSVLSSGGRNYAKDYSKCAFIKVNSDNLIPYTVLSDGEKGVPLFYFEGQTDILKEKASPLTGWELAYLKVCCKVQGVRKDLIAGSSLQIVKVSDLRAYFPRRTSFTEDCWPEPKPKSLLSKTNGVNVGYNSNPLPHYDKWTTNVPYNNSTGPPANHDPSTVVASRTPTNTLSATNVNPNVTSISISSSGSGPTSSLISARNGTIVTPTSSGCTVRVANGMSTVPTNLQANAEALRRNRHNPISSIINNYSYVRSSTS